MKVHISYDGDLDSARDAALQRLSSAVLEARKMVSTLDPGQAEIYNAKHQAALEYLDGKTDSKWVESKEEAIEILTAYNRWVDKNAQIERIRLAAKRAIIAAQNARMMFDVAKDAQERLSTD